MFRVQKVRRGTKLYERCIVTSMHTVYYFRKKETTFRRILAYWSPETQNWGAYRHPPLKNEGRTVTCLGRRLGSHWRPQRPPKETYCTRLETKRQTVRLKSQTCTVSFFLVPRWPHCLRIWLYHFISVLCVRSFRPFFFLLDLRGPLGPSFRKAHTIGVSFI